MLPNTFTSRELNHDLGRAKKAALNAPVFITDRGKPAHVLMSYAQYRKLTGARGNIVEALAMPGLTDIPFDPPRSDLSLRDVDLS